MLNRVTKAALSAKQIVGQPSHLFSRENFALTRPVRNHELIIGGYDGRVLHG